MEPRPERPEARFALLVRPAANRVFAGDAGALLRSELAVANRTALAGAIDDLGLVTIAGIEYVAFSAAADAFTPDAVPAQVVAGASSTYALFERVDAGSGEEHLRPVALPLLDRFDDDLVTTQRYVGKTNEVLTKLLVNLALATADGALAALASGGRVRLLDPLCGRGTTLNQALLRGCDALGVDRDAKDVQAYGTFLKTWLQDKRLKHRWEAAGPRRLRVAIGPKGTAGATSRQLVDVATADTTATTATFGRNSVDAVVADLPYGVQHGAHTDAGGLDRRPGDLLAVALPAWRSTVRPGGALALSWNLRVLPREVVLDTLAASGWEAVPAEPPLAFEHRVDRTITRDVVVARRSG